MTKFYKEVIGSVAGMRRGLTSGTCAQAAAKAALHYLLKKKEINSVKITLPQSKEEYSEKQIKIPVESLKIDNKKATAIIRKDSGDDNDITNGISIGALVELLPEQKKTIVITGGEGVGKISKTCSLGKKGDFAINPVPRKMITQELKDLLPEGFGCRVTIFVPDGKKIAKSTWNPRIGIDNGISIIGTRGVIEPKSKKAYELSISTVIENYHMQGINNFIITPGFVGGEYLNQKGIPLGKVVTVGDHIGHALLEASKKKAASIVLAGHIGKLAKIAAGIFNTHFTSGDARLEVIAAYAAAAGASTEIVNRILSLDLAEDSLPVISENFLEAAYGLMCERIMFRINKLIQNKKCKTGCILLSLSGEMLDYFPKDAFMDLIINGRHA